VISPDFRQRLKVLKNGKPQQLMARFTISIKFDGKYQKAV
jgi:hypothetical protein